MRGGNVTQRTETFLQGPRARRPGHHITTTTFVGTDCASTVPGSPRSILTVTP